MIPYDLMVFTGILVGFHWDFEWDLLGNFINSFMDLTKNWLVVWSKKRGLTPAVFRQRAHGCGCVKIWGI